MKLSIASDHGGFELKQEIIKYLEEKNVPLWVRHVVVPGISDDPDDLRNLGRFIGSLKNLKALDVLPYHTMGVNKYKELLMGLNIEVMKSLEGVYNVDEIIDTFTNFYYDKMILDITAIRDYQNTDNLQKLAMNINMENVILLLDDSPESDSKTYLSKLISMGFYNFTTNLEGIEYLINNPNTYKDVAHIHQLNTSTINDEPKEERKK